MSEAPVLPDLRHFSRSTDLRQTSQSGMTVRHDPTTDSRATHLADYGEGPKRVEPVELLATIWTTRRGQSPIMRTKRLKFAKRPVL